MAHSKRAAASGKPLKKGISARPGRARVVVPRVTLIPGDGIGQEVTGAAMSVLETAGVRITWDIQEAGAAALRKLGTPIPDSLINSLRRTRIALKGPLATEVGQGYRSINVYLRKM